MQSHLEVEYKKPDAIRAYDKNSRRHNDEQVAEIIESIQEFGFTNPILIDEDGEIIAGHGRLAAANKMNLDEVPTITLAGLSDHQKRAYVIADNKLALNASWDKKLLKLELQSLSEADYQLTLTGFKEHELRSLEIVENDEAENEMPNPGQVETRVKAGELWALGRHLMICGDSTNGEDVARLFAQCAGRPNLMVTDPPYGVEYDANWRNEVKRESRAIGKVQNDDRADWREAWALFPGDVAYVWHAGNKCHIVAESLMAVGFELRAQIIWAKNNIVIGRGHYHPKHEPCWYVVRNSGSKWCGSRKENTLWQIDKPMKSETGHSTQKPVECMRRPMVNNSAAGDLVYDPFLGSGTSIIAAETVDRSCVGVELNPEYCDIILARWEALTGEKAERVE